MYQYYVHSICIYLRHKILLVRVTQSMVPADEGLIPENKIRLLQYTDIQLFPHLHI